MDEIQIIAREFEKMKSSLREARVKLEEEKASVERKIVERTRELAEEQARLVASVDSLSFGFLLVDKELRIILKNPAIERIFELEAKDIVDLKLLTGALKDGFDLEARCQECLEKGVIINQKDIPFKNKFLRIFMVPVTLLKDHKEIIGAVTVIEDITEEKVMVRAREEFFAVASHELRTPLTAIRGNMAMIKDFFKAELKPEIMEMIDDSYGASVRLIGIVNDFLDVSRLEQGQVSFKKEKIEMAEIIEEVLKEVAELAKNKKLTLTFKNPEKMKYFAVADRDRTKQIIYNFVGNGINYTPQGSVTLEIKKEKGELNIFITDTGAGISLPNQSLLFRKFQQAGEKILVRDVTKGTGLGLYISKLIAESMGGRVWLEKSELGKGSTFAFALPLAK